MSSSESGSEYLDPILEPTDAEKNIDENKVALVKTGKRTYIYKCNKEELQQVLKEENIDYRSNASVDELRKILSDYYKSKSINLNPKMSMCGEIKSFGGEKWDVFVEQLDSFMVVNDIPNEKKVPLLITKLTPEIFEVLQCLCSPTKPNKLSYEELCSKLKEKYNKPRSTTIERAEFRRRNQLPNEKIQDYVLQLKLLAIKCNFKDTEDQIKEKFIDGVTSKMIKYELMKNADNKSLENCVEIARSIEAALMCNNEHSPEVTDIFYNKNKHNQGTKFKKNCKPKEQQCFCCGKNNHFRAQCSLRKKYCSECGQQGHIFKMCRKQQKQTNVLETKSSEDEREDNEAIDSVKNLYEEYETYSFNSVSRIPPHFIKLNVNNKDILFQLDTGSDVTVISLNDKNNFFKNYSLQACKILFKNFDQSVTQPLGLLCNIPVKFNQESKHLNVFVVQNNCPRVLGRDWLKELKLWPPKINNDLYFGINQVQSISDAQQIVKSQFAEVFSPGWGNFKGEEIVLKLNPDSKPICLPVRRVPFALREKVNNEIKRLIDNGRIEPVQQSEWGTPVVPILKSDGSVRLCGDYKLTVNKCLQVDHFPLPHVDDILNTLKHGEYYCELDLKEAYLQARLIADSQNCTTIVTEVGTYKYKYLPYGVSTGPGAFQRLMTQKLQNVPNTIVFIDNIYIKGKTLQETYNTLCTVLTKLHESEFKLKMEKCKLFTKHIEVFGYRVDKNGISIIKSNIEPLLNAKSPTNLTMLKSFLGKINYYNRFLKDMATEIAPLYNCTKKNKFVWTPDCENAFNNIKKKLANARNLRHYDPQLPVILTCDASDVGLGAVLSNRDLNGVVKPIAYASKKLNETEQRYSTLDKEAMAVIFGITKFYNYIYGRHFELETDNAALMRIFGPTKSIPKMAAKRLQHYAIFMSAFNYKVRHIKSTDNPADYLSRTATNTETNKMYINSLCIDKEFSYECYVNDSEISTLYWKKVQQETIKDLNLTKLIRYLSDGWPNKKNIPKDFLPFFNRKEELSIDRGCVFWGYRIIIPSTLQQLVLNELHKSHFGIIRMKEIARSYFWWPNLNKEIENITKNCIVCLQNSKSPSKIQKPWPVPPSPWYRIHADFLGPFYNKMYLIVVDSYSKWPEAFEMTNITSTRTIEVFKTLFSRFGFPVHLVTDNGRTFTSTDFQEYCKENQIKHTFTPPYHPATNGAAEKFVDTFKSAVTKIKESGYGLTSAVNLFLSDYRNSPQRTTGVTPARLMLGREIRNRFSLLRPPPLVDVVWENVEKRNQGNRQIQFVVGQKVMVKDYRKGAKPWVQGLVIEESIPGISYIVDVEGAQWKRHVNQMLHCSQELE